MPGLFQSPPGLNRTVSFFGVLVNFADFREQDPIELAAPALFATVPVVIPAAADLQNPAHPFDGKLSVMSSEQTRTSLELLGKVRGCLF